MYLNNRKYLPPIPKMSTNPSFEGVLIELNFKGVNINASGLLVNNNLVVTCGYPLISLFQKKLIYSAPQDFEKYLNAAIVTEKGNRKEKGIKEDDDYVWRKAKLISVKVCYELGKKFNNELSSWSTLQGDEKKYYSDLANDKVLRDILISFLFFEISDGENVGHFDNSLQCLMKQCYNYLNRGDMVCLETTPFGNIAFLNSHSRGICSGFVDNSNHLFLTDASSAPGSEGGPIFNIVKSENGDIIKVPVGLVLSSLSFWKDEWVGFTLAITFSGIFGEFNSSVVQKSLSNTFFDKLNKSIVKVACLSGWGTGILVFKDKNESLIVTNSHVVKNCHYGIKCQWLDKNFKADLLYRTNDGIPYDIAILKSKSKVIEQMEPILFHSDQLIKGELVYSVGYPFFNNSEQNLATVSRGSLSNMSTCMIQTSCCVQPGASGGPIVRPNGELIGILVCNTTNTKSNITFPFINLSVPSTLIKIVLNNYLYNKDPAVFRQLETEDLNVIKRWNLFNYKL